MAECVLIYLDPKESEDIIGWIAKRFHTAMFINYQPVIFQYFTCAACLFTYFTNSIVTLFSAWIEIDFIPFRLI